MTTTSALAPQTSLSHPPSATNVVYSIIIPTYKEAKNLPTVIPNIYAALQQSPFLNQTEVVVVDDNSQDGTIQVCDELIKRFGVPGGFTIRLITRTTDRGLSSAVLRGFSDSHGSYLLCMDADGQHPAHVLPRLFTALHTSEFVIGTRKGGKVDSSWGLGRTIISKGAGALVIPLTSMSDPMTGMFGIRRATLARGLSEIDPRGFKIALEIFVKCGVKGHAEVPIDFGVRTEGESKLGTKVIVQYLVQLMHLYYFILLCALARRPRTLKARGHRD